MITTIKETVSLHNGVEIPQLGYGVFKVENGRQTVESVKKALEVGYRLIDTATVYQYELIPLLPTIIYKKNPTRVDT